MTPRPPISAHLSRRYGTMENPQSSSILTRRQTSPVCGNEIQRKLHRWRHPNMTFKYFLAISLTCICSAAAAQYRYGALPASQLPRDRVVQNVADLQTLTEQSTNVPLQSDQLLGPVPPSNSLMVERPLGFGYFICMNTRPEPSFRTQRWCSVRFSNDPTAADMITIR